VYAIHGVDETCKAGLVKPKVTRDQLVALIGQLPPCLIGMEACQVRITGPACSSEVAMR
jgi:transposase